MMSIAQKPMWVFILVTCFLTSAGWAGADPRESLGHVGIERVPARVSERAWRQYQQRAERTEKTPPPALDPEDALPNETVEPTEPPAVAPTPAPVPTPSEATPPAETVADKPTPPPVPANLPTFIGQLMRVTADAIVVRNPQTKEQKTLHRAGVLLKDFVVGDAVAVQYAPDRESVVAMQKQPPPAAVAAPGPQVKK